MNPEIQRTVLFFLPESRLIKCIPLGRGNVNDTWCITLDSGERCVLQRLNPHVFSDPDLVQKNILTVTHHLRRRLQSLPNRLVVLKLFTGSNGNCSYIAPDGSWWRMLSYIENSRTLDTITDDRQAREIGQALGLFHLLCTSLDPKTLHDPLPRLHDTPCYLKQYDLLLSSAPQSEDDACRNFINARRQDVNLLEDAQHSSLCPLQIIHGDPKAANFLFARNEDRVISLIDLDTVKPGLLLHDVGDCLRSCCNDSGEELQTEDDVRFDSELFAAVLTGYSRYGAAVLTAGEKKLIVAAVRLISFELGLRFYTDYLAGNRYFKVTSPQQNLLRARVQFKLVHSIEEQYSALENICSAALHDGSNSD